MRGRPGASPAGAGSRPGVAARRSGGRLQLSTQAAIEFLDPTGPEGRRSQSDRPVGEEDLAHGPDVRSLWALWTFGDVELDPLAVFQALVPRSPSHHSTAELYAPFHPLDTREVGSLGPEESFMSLLPWEKS